MTEKKDRVNPENFNLFIGSFIPNIILKNKELSPGAKLVWSRLGYHADSKGVCSPNRRDVAKEIGISVDEVNLYLQELVDKGIMRKE